MNKIELIDKIIELEWKYFTNLNNIGSRASCQDNKEDFIIMRKAQWLTLNEEILFSYLNDLKTYNPLWEKYARMMKYNSPNEYEKIKNNLSEISLEKEMLVEKIMTIYMKLEKEFFNSFPLYASMSRPLNSVDDDNIETSIETYLKGELLSYSLNTLKLYLCYIENKKENIVIENMDNIAKLQGFYNSSEVEKYLEKNSIQ